jgi:hypothetical protein
VTVPSGPSLVTVGGIAVAGGWGEPESNQQADETTGKTGAPRQEASE